MIWILIGIGLLTLLFIVSTFVIISRLRKEEINILSKKKDFNPQQELLDMTTIDPTAINLKVAYFAEILKKHPFSVIIPIILATIGITYEAVNFHYDKYKIEVFKQENEIATNGRNQQMEINYSNNRSNYLLALFQSQQKLQEKLNALVVSNHKTSSKQKTSIYKLSDEINHAAVVGGALLQLDPTESKTFKLFNNWRSQCIPILNQIDNKFSTKYAMIFSALTDNNMSDFQKLKAKVNDGLVVLKTI